MEAGSRRGSWSSRPLVSSRSSGDPDRLKAADGIDQTKVDPRPAISTTINSILGTTPQPNEH